jgi:hypothetical protein
VKRASGFRLGSQPAQAFAASSGKAIGQRESEMCQTSLPHLRVLVLLGVNRHDVHKSHHHITPWWHLGRGSREWSAFSPGRPITDFLLPQLN